MLIVWHWNTRSVGLSLYRLLWVVRMFVSTIMWWMSHDYAKEFDEIMVTIDVVVIVNIVVIIIIQLP